MTDRAKLIELLKSGGVRDFPFNAALADHLIANGVRLEEKQATSNESKWIPVTERLPDKHGKYLAVVPSKWVGVEHSIWLIWYHPKSGFYDSDPEWGDIEMDDVTHWMPLPESLKGD